MHTVIPYTNPHPDLPGPDLPKLALYRLSPYHRHHARQCCEAQRLWVRHPDAFRNGGLIANKRLCNMVFQRPHALTIEVMLFA